MNTNAMPNVDLNDFALINQFTEQAMLFAQNIPQNAQALGQAQWWMQRRAALLQQLQAQQAQAHQVPPQLLQTGAPTAPFMGQPPGQPSPVRAPSIFSAPAAPTPPSTQGMSNPLVANAAH